MKKGNHDSIVNYNNRIIESTNDLTAENTLSGRAYRNRTRAKLQSGCDYLRKKPASNLGTIAYNNQDIHASLSNLRDKHRIQSASKYVGGKNSKI
jgi:hypothetical protein